MEYTLSLPMPPPAGAEPSGRTAVIVLGGDARQVAVIRALTGAGCAVYAAGLCGAAGLPEGVRLCGSLAACLRAAGETGAPEMLTLLLPLPVSRDGETVHCPLEPTAHIPLSDIADVLDSVPETRLLGGCLPADFRAELARRLGADGARTRVVDYYTLETVQVPNARITAEAAVMTAMERHRPAGEQNGCHRLRAHRAVSGAAAAGDGRVRDRLRTPGREPCLRAG